MPKLKFKSDSTFGSMDVLSIRIPDRTGTNLLNQAAVCADELEALINDQYSSREEQPVQQRRYDRDMQIVRDLRETIDALSEIDPWES
ncbi:MAG: hypothetical protein AAGD43_18045 [Pseudomonadota bacterium]